MKKLGQISLLLCLTVALFSLCACGSNAADVLPAIPEGAVVYTSEEAAAMLSDPAQWGMPSLEKHQVYLQEDTLCADFAFSKDAGDAEIDKASSFAVDAFVLLHSTMLGPSPYSELVAERQTGAANWTAVQCRIYRGEELVFENRYDHIYDGNTD